MHSLSEFLRSLQFAPLAASPLNSGRPHYFASSDNNAAKPQAV
jgi:hypothetical protein